MTYRHIVVAHDASVARTGPPRILVVDDDRLLRASTERMLRRACAVTTAGDGAEALALFRAGARFDLVLSDMCMPRLSGQRLYETLCRELPEQAARFMFMTAGAASDEGKAFLRAVPVRVLHKPVAGGALRAAIDELLAGTPVPDFARGSGRIPVL